MGRLILKRWLKAVAVAVAGGVFLTGCGPEVPPNGPEVPPDDNYGLSVSHLQVDGRDVTCVVYSNFRQGGLSCDWGHN